MTEPQLPLIRSQRCAKGTAFDREPLWSALSAIPPGRVISYGALAKLAGIGRGARLVGRLLQQLPEDSNLPWHRVVNSQGKLSLPADSRSGEEQVQRLLAEGVIIRNRRINMRLYSWPEQFPDSQRSKDQYE